MASLLLCLSSWWRSAGGLPCLPLLSRPSLAGAGGSHGQGASRAASQPLGKMESGLLGWRLLSEAATQSWWGQVPWGYLCPRGLVSELAASLLPSSLEMRRASRESVGLPSPLPPTNRHQIWSFLPLNNCLVFPFSPSLSHPLICWAAGLQGAVNWLL